MRRPGPGVACDRICVVLLERLRVPLSEFESASGWSLKPQGACRGDVCVPLPADAVQDGVVDVLPWPNGSGCRSCTTPTPGCGRSVRRR